MKTAHPSNQPSLQINRRHRPPFILFALAAMLLAFTLSPAYGQGTISGRLQHEEKAEPIAYANIALLRAADSLFVRGTTSDPQGRFSLKADSVAAVIRISAVGYETLFIPVGQPQADTSLGAIHLKEGAMMLEAVEVSAAKPMYAVDGEKKLYNVSEDPSVQAGTAQDALQNAPGVQIDAEGNITLNGQGVSVWINDRPSHMGGEALRQYIKQLPASAISTIEVMKHPSAKYGSGGPVINIKTGTTMLRNSYFSFGLNGSSEPSLVPYTQYIYANDKLHMSAYLSYSGRRNKSTSHGEGELYDSDSLLIRQYTSSGEGESSYHNLNFNFDLSYEFDSMNTLSFDFYTYPS
ncbi:MAG: TonB-dependent receptor [Bacteroidales bacterium]|nr:TonB-dependent receptor [Bacteroidales bacterium]